eukprot:scaffold15381_cov152-Amphora_coffeaeformis.AAC.1
MLVIEQAHIRKPPLASESITGPWEDMIRKASHPPNLIMETWHPCSATWEGGPSSKAVRTKWTHLGYDTRSKWVSATQCGGAVEQSRLLVLRRASGLTSQWRWPELDTEVAARPSANLLTPPGLVLRTSLRKALPRGVQRCTDPKWGALPGNELGR